MNGKARASNIELARIVCVTAIMMGHFIGQSQSPLKGGFVVFFLGSGSRISTSVYILISCWFLQDSHANARKAFQIWFTMLFYNLLASALVLLCGQKLSPLDICTALLPFARKTPWFGSAYISILLLHPFLKKITLLKERSLMLLSAALFLIAPILCMFSNPMDTYLCHVCTFVILYVIIGYLKQYGAPLYARSIGGGRRLPDLRFTALWFSQEVARMLLRTGRRCRICMT